MKEKRKTKKYLEGHFLGMWMGICIVISMAFGIPLMFVLKNPGFLGVAPAIGVSIGVAIGQSVEDKYKKEGKIRPLTKKEKKTKEMFVVVGAIVFLIGLGALVSAMLLR